MIEGRRLHDAVLRRVIIVQSEASCQLELATVTDGARCLEAKRFRSIVIAREQPWGPSNSVNDIRGPLEDDEGYCLLEVQLQSGDVIRILAEDFVLRDTQAED
jgi:hypothetical protein